MIESPLRLHGASTFPDGERICGRRRLKHGDVLVALCLRGLLEKFGGTSLPQNHKRLQRDL